LEQFDPGCGSVCLLQPAWPVMRIPTARFHTLAAQLRRRRVPQAAALYVASVFVVLQAADLLIEGLGLPTWLLTLLIVVGACGLPAVLVLAWVFDVTPSGIHRTDTNPVDVSVTGPRTRLLISAMVLLLVGASSYGAYKRLGSGSGSSPPSVAVLPFADLGGDSADEYLRDGLTEDVLTQLAKASGLRVISRTSVMQYKGTMKSLPAIAAELGATHILEGSVRRSGGRLRISAQLIDARTDQHVWAEVYDRQPDDIFEVQSDIAKRIAAALRVKLTAEERDRIEAMPTLNSAAYDDFLRARQHLYRYEREANEVAIQLARRALQADPELAPAHALLGTAFAFKVRLGEGPEWGDSGMIAAQRAITLDPRLAEGHLALGNAHGRQGRYPEALQSYARAAALNPSDWRAAINSAVVYSYQGEPLEALRWTRRAMLMDPRSPLIGIAYQNLASYYLDLSLADRAEAALAGARETQPADHPQLRMYDVAIALQRGQHARARAIADSLAADAPSDASALLTAGDAYLFSGHLVGARVYYQRAYALSPTAEGIRHYAPALLGYVLWRQGDRARAERLFADVEELAREEISKGHDNYTSFLSLAAVAALHGDSDRAFGHLARAVASAGVVLEWTITHDPLLHGIRDDARYRGLEAELRTRGDALRRQAVREQL
jgi:TolB-like protein/Flp pilus assembly protein TadD